MNNRLATKRDELDKLVKSASPTSKNSEILKFSSGAEAERAGKEGRLKPGQKIMVGGRAATWNP
jgi:hypothetical protein